MNIMSLISSNELCKCNLQMYGATSFTNAAMHKRIKPDSMGWVCNSTHIFIQYIISHGCANEMEDENDCKLMYLLPLKSKKVRLNYLTIQYRIHHRYLNIQKISNPPHPLRNRIKKVEVNAKLYEPLQLTPDKIRQKIKWLLFVSRLQHQWVRSRIVWPGESQ